MMARKAALKIDLSVDDLIEKSMSKHPPRGIMWLDKMSETGRLVVAKVEHREMSSAAMLAVMKDVMTEVCPEDVDHLPSEGTIRKWLRDRRRSRQAGK